MTYSEARHSAELPVQSTDREGLGTGFRDLGNQLAELGSQVMQFLDYKVDLIRSETRETVRSYTRGTIMGAVGGVLAAFASLFIMIAIAAGLAALFPFSNPVNYALGFLIVAVVDGIIGGLLLWVCKRQFAKQTPVPKKSIDDLKRDKEWLENQVA